MVAFISPFPGSLLSNRIPSTCNRNHSNATRLTATAVAASSSATDTPVRVGIMGASGYTGVELLRLLAQHPRAEITTLTADRSAGKTMGDVYAQFSFGSFGTSLPNLVKNNEISDWTTVADVVFCCLPHGTTQEIIAALPIDKGLRVVDLSADFRLNDTDLYAKWYGDQHKAPHLQKEAVYGLTELARDEVRSARLVANPGCYPTAAQLSLVPLLQEKLISASDIIIDAKSGTTGAGRSPKQNTLFCEVTDGIGAYGVATHRHTPEIEQGLSQAQGEQVHATFTPHLMPMSRGILETMYVKPSPGCNATHLRECLQKRFESEPFVHVLDDGLPTPQTRHVRGSNHCVIAVVEGAVPGSAIIITVIDNVVKGASGQAIQNMNVMLGLPETMGLEAQPVFP